MGLPVEMIKGFEPDPNASTEPIKIGRGSQNRTPRNSSKPSGNANRNSNNDNRSRAPKRNTDRRS
jgi:ATP-dependent RNA helicase RhlE